MYLFWRHRSAANLGAFHYLHKHLGVKRGGGGGGQTSRAFLFRSIAFKKKYKKGGGGGVQIACRNVYIFNGRPRRDRSLITGKGGGGY